MKTVTENNTGLYDKDYPFPEETRKILNRTKHELYCSMVKFTRFSDEESSKFVDEVGRYFHS